MLFPDPFREFDMLTDSLFQARQAPARPLPLDAWKDDSALHLEFELPGVTSDHIDLQVDRNVLTLTVDKPVREITGKRVVGERAYGRMSRSLTLGEELNLDEIHASLEAGVLHLTIPVSERSKPRRIAIGTSDTPELQQTGS